MTSPFTLRAEHSVEGETWMQAAVQMIAEQRGPEEILGTLCRDTDHQATGPQVAVFLIDGEQWMLAAASHLTPAAEAALAGISPGSLSEALFKPRPAGPGRRESPFESGWARHLTSGTGELLGLVVGLADGPMLPFGIHATRIESMCRLAALAVEQNHLLREVTYRAGHDSLITLFKRSYDREISTQRIAQMITRQCPPAEILDALCRHIGHAESERQVAFFLVDGDKWTLAAKGALTARAEALLAGIDPGGLSDGLFKPAPQGRLECPFDFGWGRNLYSGTGELMGIVVGIADGPMQPFGLYLTRIESVCRLAVLAIEQRNLMQDLSFQANHDSLTTLFNRNYYERALRWMLREKSRTGGFVALIFIDLDRLRMVNDVMGMAVGNRLLEQVGRRFQACLRTGDLLARVGGDEFAVLLPGLAAEESGDAVAGRLLRSLAKPFLIDGHELFVSASIGIGRSTPESTPESLEREAYVALYRAKRAGKGRSLSFHPSRAATPPERLEMEKRLRFALERREMLLYYQPQVELSSGRVTGAEALLRWRPEGLGLVCPASFIPILEETGLIVDFGHWVLREAARQAKEWAGMTGGRPRIAVNVSALQFALPEFARNVEKALAESGCPPELLELELTESLVIGDLPSARRIFNTLRATGITFALDDFGTGQSALSYLQDLPFQRLKIDQSFISRIEEGAEYPALVEGIIRMAQGLGMGTLAEGVETAHQADALRALGCDEVQGFLFARPLPPDEFLSYWRENQAGGVPVS